VKLASLLYSPPYRVLRSAKLFKDISCKINTDKLKRSKKVPFWGCRGERRGKEEKVKVKR